MANIMIPTALRLHADGSKEIELPGDTVGDAISNLTDRYPGLREHLLDDAGDLRAFVNVFVGDENIRDLQQSQTPLTDRDQVTIVPAIAGG